MNTKRKDFLHIASSLLIMICVGYFNCDAVNAATRAAVRGAPVARRAPTTTATATTTTVATASETTPSPEPEVNINIENKSAQFANTLSESGVSDSDDTAAKLADKIRQQRAAFEAKENALYVQTSQNSGQNTCDIKLRECMKKTCGDDFSKCATDGDTIFGDKLNSCRRDTNCTGHEFQVFSQEIKADRDTNVKLLSYTSVIDCGNSYNSCIQKICGTTFDKCLGKTASDNAMQECAAIAKRCTEQDSGLASRFGSVIGTLRENAEKDVKTDESRLVELRDLMRANCEKLGAMFDERSFDCVYTVNFFAGDNKTTPTASRKVYAGDTFTCLQEWFGVNATTFKENAYRETRAQTAASSAMLGSGVGSAVGLVTSGAIGRALDTQKAKKALKAEEKAQEQKQENEEVNQQGNKQQVELLKTNNQEVKVKNTFKTVDGSIDAVYEQTKSKQLQTVKQDMNDITKEVPKPFDLQESKDFANDVNNITINTQQKRESAWGTVSTRSNKPQVTQNNKS